MAHEHGRVFSPNWLQYLVIARDARDEVAAPPGDDPPADGARCLVAIVFSALATEAFINDLAESADLDAGRREMWGIASTPTLQCLGDLANVLQEVERDRGSLTLKYQMARRVLAGHTYEQDRAPFQDFRRLVSLRDLLVHPRALDEVDADGNIVPMSKLIVGFQQQGLTRSRPPKHGEEGPSMSWLQQIKTAKMAGWACDAADGIIRDLGSAIPAELGINVTNAIREQTQLRP